MEEVYVQQWRLMMMNYVKEQFILKTKGSYQEILSTMSVIPNNPDILMDIKNATKPNTNTTSHVAD